ncbi:MAG: hypothetical protein K2X77_26485 [Candidatus Obscuribacterales bacterium]|jgi:tetratricopeptide (TPR) repeat protein|nr:hypothetical protein [Candidatus Obscuribacterales bacterium]
MSENSATKSDEQNSSLDLLEQARQLLERKDLVGCFLLSKEHWLNNPDDVQAVEILSEVMRRNGKKELYKNLKTLCCSKDEMNSNAQSLFEAGYQFIEEREPELAAMLLRRCVTLVPDQPMVRYELGFALMQLRQFAEATQHFEFLIQSEDDFDTRLNLTVCYSLTRDIKRAKELLCELEKKAGNTEEKKELQLRKCVVKRLEKYEQHHQLHFRDWVYALYGSVLLSDTTPKDLEGKPRSSATDYNAVATTLLLLRGLLQEMAIEFDVIEYYSPLSRPLAEAFARLLDLSAEAYKGPDRQERALLMMAWASDIIGPHKTFVAQTPRRSLFAYGLTTLAQLPVTPDIIGCLAVECSMPWAQDLDNVEDKRDEKSVVHPMNLIQQQATEAILERASALESNTEIIRQLEVLCSFYHPRREMIVLSNCQSFPERPEYTAEIPC